jgi:nitrogen regulatory protein PII
VKLVHAIIKPFKLENVRDALARVGIEGLTISEANGFGRQKGHTEIYRGAEYQIDLVPKLSLEVVIRDDQLEEVLNAICESAGTGKIGDGKIFVAQVEQAVRIRTGEIGEAAL